MIKRILFLLITIPFLASLLNCSSSDSKGVQCTSDTEPYGVTALELRDPVSCTEDNFGDSVVVLPNGNVVVSDPNDSSKNIRNGAVHLYDPATQALISSFFGSSKRESLGWNAVTVLPNNNFVINSTIHGADGGTGAGAVTLVDGNSGTQIGETIFGSSDHSRLGLRGAFALPNSNFVIISLLENVGDTDHDHPFAVKLIDGTNNLQIGDSFVGDTVTVLANNNYVIRNANSKKNDLDGAGSVSLISGKTGSIIGNPVVGDAANDHLGGSGITALPNNNYVILSFSDDEGGDIDVGSIRIVNGETGVQISNATLGVSGDDFRNHGTVTSLTNGNVVLALPYADSSGIRDAGKVSLFDGLTGSQLGSSIVGDNVEDLLGLGVTALSNGNYIIISGNDDVGGISNVGSLMLVDGSTGNLISTYTSGFSRDPAALLNGNYAVTSSFETVTGQVSAGIVRLFDGNTGIQIGNSVIGDAGDSLGSGGLAALDNNNIAILSSDDKSKVGSIILIDGVNANIIGNPVFGQSEGDFSGVFVQSLSGDKYVAISNNYTKPQTNENVSAALLIDGVTNNQIGETIFGRSEVDVVDDEEDEDDPLPANFIATDLNTIDYFILSSGGANANELQDSGFVGLVKKTP